MVRVRDRVLTQQYSLVIFDLLLYFGQFHEARNRQKQSRTLSV